MAIFGKECFARMVMKYGKIRRNVIRALLCTKVRTQGLRFGITAALRWNVGACMGRRKRKESMECIKKDEGSCAPPESRGLRGSRYTGVELERTRDVAKRAAGKVNPEILIFDVDGVLIDVKETFWRSALQTVEKLTGRKATWAELHRWKRQPGNNDDWMMVSQWATASGVPTTYEEAREAFQPFYWGSNGKPGNVVKEKWLVTPKLVEKWARRRELNLFTGRTRPEFAYSFERWPGGKHFRKVVTMDDARKKPYPDGLLAILGKRDPKTALYLGDNVDDALSARAAGVPFMAILPRSAYDFRERAKKFHELGALKLLERARDLDRWLV
jgi:HAD superfamily phosphatase